MTVYSFTLIVEGADLQSDDAQEALFAGNCDDATFGAVDGVQFAEFDREAGSFGLALASAMTDLRNSVAGVNVVHVEPDELVTMAEIAERLGRTRESIRLLIVGERGSGDFPPPVSHLRARTRLWRWPDVLQWFRVRYPDEHDRLEDLPGAAHITAMLNGYLTYRKYSATLSEEDRKLLEEAVG